MSSSHHRSTSSRSSRQTQTNGQIHNQRSTSAPQRQFIFILTNNPELLRHTRQYQLQSQQPMQGIATIQNISTNQRTANNDNNNTNNHEQLLDNLLRVELREATEGYLSRTRQMYPIHRVLNMSDIEF